MNLCKNCIHYVVKQPVSEHPIRICFREGKANINPVTGDFIYVKTRYCRTERKKRWFSKRCGPKGKYFVERKGIVEPEPPQGGSGVRLVK